MTTRREQEDYIPQHINAMLQRTQSALSPWVQRALKNAGSNALRANQPAALSQPLGQTLVEHLNSVARRTTVFKPNLGSLEPGMVARFGSAIVQRFDNFGGKYTVEPSQSAAGDFPLAGYPDFAAAGQAGASVSSLGRQPSLSHIPSAQRLPPFPPSAPPKQTPPVQRKPVSPAVSPSKPRSASKKTAPDKTSPQKRRLRSRVEEIAPSAQTQRKPEIQRDLTAARRLRTADEGRMTNDEGRMTSDRRPQTAEVAAPVSDEP